MNELLSLLPGFSSSTVVHECRNCGTKCEDGTECSNCGSTSVASYELE